MAFLSLAASGDGAERVDVGLEYNQNNLRVQGLFFQGAITRDLTVTVTFEYDIGAGVQTGSFGPFQAKNTQTGRLQNLAGLGIFMQEITESEDEEGNPLPEPHETYIWWPAELLTWTVTWGNH